MPKKSRVLCERFGSFKEEIEAAAHLPLNDPPQLQETVVSHLRYMWTHVMSMTLFERCRISCEPEAVEPTQKGV
jgi:hypothetical protein